MRIWLIVLILAMSPLTAYAQTASFAARNIILPPPTGVFDYQLGDTYDTLPDGRSIDVVVRDATADPLPGAYNICYINGFQTQPGEADLWLDGKEHLLLHDDNGELVTDPDWPDEYILDPSTIEQQEGILLMIAPLIARCGDAGFDAVEFDNLDTFTRFPQIDPDGALMLANTYADLAHEHDLAIAQKNTAELATIKETYPDLLVDVPAFDFAIAEECGVFDECERYADVYGDHVLQIEYPDTLEEARITFADVYAIPGRAPLTILRDRHLAPIGDPEYVYEACPPRD